MSSFFFPSFLLTVFLYLLFVFCRPFRALQIPCLVGMCTSRHSKLLEEHGTRPSANADYCILLKDYLACLNDSFPTCLSHLDFHSANSAATQRWKKFNCQRFEEKRKGELECHFWGEDEEEEEEDQKEDYEYGDGLEEQEHGDGSSISDKCALFGQLNLRPFSSQHLEQCKFEGATALFDNRFFLVQITANAFLFPSSNSSQANAPLTVSKVAIILRPREGCVPGHKVYLADVADPGPFPDTFEDGSAKIAESSSKKILEIVVSDEGNRVDLLLNHLATIVRIRKYENKFLDIFVHAPRRLLNMHHESKNLCTDGCLKAKEAELEKDAPCEEGKVELIRKYCSGLLAGRSLPTEWTKLCLGQFAHPMASLWDKSIRATLEDFFGKIMEGTNHTEEGHPSSPLPSLGSSRCPLLSANSNSNTATSLQPPTTSSSFRPFPHHCQPLILCYLLIMSFLLFT